MSLYDGVGTPRRAPRVKLVGTVLALVQLENGRQIQSRIHQLSVTGGLLYLERPVDEGIRVELIFHVGNSTLRCGAVTMFPMWATQGCLQPFQFTEIQEKDQRSLALDLQNLLAQNVVSHTSDVTGRAHTAIENF